MVLIPDMCDGLFVLVVSRPDGDLVTFGTDVDDCSAHIVTVFIKRLPHQTEDLNQTRLHINKPKHGYIKH